MLVNVVVRVWRTWTKSIAGQPGWRNDRDRFVDEVSWGYDRDHAATTGTAAATTAVTSATDTATDLVRR
ncbi:hypothetical protein AB0L14_21360 [Streptomyces sp. NPDC052727]|uniref:hypothetical protein n=1 Tax=Streptomyces sp. NPDC052727 TaxID=3154854 RepID=UPI0034149553